MTNWRSWHLHTHGAGQEALDAVVTGVVAAASEHLDGTPWFFMRYWQGGPHVRLRVHEGAPAIENLLAERLAAVEVALGGSPRIDEAAYAADAGMLAAGGEGGVALGVEELREPGVHPAHYAPEIDRYGGPGLIGASEQLFWLSSRLTLAVLVRGVPREAFALEAVAAAGAALGGHEARERFALGARDGWLEWGRRARKSDETDEAGTAGVLRAARVLVERLERGGQAVRILETENGPIQRWREALTDAVAVWRTDATATAAPEEILASHAHMLLNRLGLGPPQEVVIHATIGELLHRRAGAPR